MSFFFFFKNFGCVSYTRKKQTKAAKENTHLKIKMQQYISQQI